MIRSLKKIVIIGGGAGGLELATSLGHKLGRRQQAEIILVDRNHIHLWKPLLHEVAVGSLDDSVDALSYMAHARHHGYQFQLGTMHDIDRANNNILLDEIRDSQRELVVPKRRLSYDILVVALGSISNDFGTAGVKEHCLFLDSTRQAKIFQNKMLNLFLKFSMQDKIGAKVNIVIVGGGATGVELSAELYNAVQQLHSYGFKGIDHNTLNVTLIEAGERILPAMSPSIAVAVHKELTKLGVRVITQKMVTSADAGGLHTKNGEYIQAELMVWAAGIKVQNFLSPVGGLEINHINQLLVQPTLQTTRDPLIFAIGDCASCTMPDGSLVPPRAQAAHQMAYHAQDNILALLSDRPLKAYIYKDHGALISLSRFNTIGSMSNLSCGSMMIQGRIARLFYLFLYRRHQISLHGYIKTCLIMLVGSINRIIRPHLKLH